MSGLFREKGVEWGSIHERSGNCEGDTVFNLYTRKTVHAFFCPTSVCTSIRCWPKASQTLNLTSDSGQCPIQCSQYYCTTEGQKVSLHAISFHNYKNYRTQSSTYKQLIPMHVEHYTMHVHTIIYLKINP